MTETKKIGFLTSTSLVVAAMIGTGVFTSLGFQVINIKSGFAIIMLWVFGGISAFCGATTYAELGSAFPKSGGEYALLSRLIHPSLGFVAGWVSATVGFAAPASIAAIAFASYSSGFFPGIPENHMAAGLIVFFTALHAFSLRLGTLFQEVSTILKTILILTFIAFAFFVEGSTSITLIPQEQSMDEIFSGGFAVSLVFVTYAYTGWNSSIYIVGDIDRPRNLPRSLFAGTALVTILYLLLNYAFLYTVPIPELAGQIEIGYLSGVAIFGELGGLMMAGTISFLLLSTVSAYVFLGPRIMQIMGQDFKALQWFASSSSKGIPVNAFLFSLILSLTFIYTSSFDQVVVYTSFLLILITTLTVASIFVLRVKFKQIKVVYKTWGYPFTPIVFLMLNIWILGYLLIDKFVESVVALIILFVGSLLYFLTERLSKEKEKAAK